MDIYFVRHGDPNYEKDCLTELGHKQAQAAAERLAGSNISEIYSSVRGRAVQTAEYTANKFGLDIVPCDFMIEINWRSIDGQPILENGHPWLVVDHLVAEGKSLRDEDWRTKEPFCKSMIVNSQKKVSEGIDNLLEGLGYRREGEYYRVVGENTKKNIAIFSHCGSSAVAMAHMLNIPLPQFFGSLRAGFTSITVIRFSDTIGALCAPELFLFNDLRHIENIKSENIFGN